VKKVNTLILYTVPTEAEKGKTN